MKPAPFEYHAPDSVEQAIELLTEHGWEAKLLAGGQSLIPAMNFRLAQPAVLIDLGSIGELAGVQPEDDGGVTIGAMTRQRTVERDPVIAERSPLLHHTMPSIAHPQIRNRGTIGGSIAHADPSAELPVVARVLDATFHARGPHGDRAVPASEFFVGLFTTALETDEVLLSVALPARAPRTGFAFRELSRRHGDYAIAGVATSLTLAEDGTCTTARIGLLSVGDGPVLAEEAQNALTGVSLSGADDAAFVEAAEIAATADIDPLGDVHATPEYRRQLVRVLVCRALREAAAEARA